MNPVEICGWADKKGISVIGTGDFQHPAYLGELKNKLEEAEPGLYKVKKSKFKSRMVLSTEISHIYKQGDKVRKVHMLVIMPDMLSAEKFSKKLATLGNTGSDGRPILGFPAKDLVKLTLDIAPDAMVIPAHVWTPWFSVFGSKSGFDSIEECFEDQAKHIHAIETGLSSDAAMNHRISALDNITLISNSDAHSPRKIGREANVFECSLEYKTIKNAIYKKDKKKFLYTIEFFPEEGKYHNDGHRLCGINYHPKESIKNKNICPVCNKTLVLGVLHRVEELADRPWDYISKDAIPQKHVIPLEEIIADVKEVSPSSKKVQEAYEKMLVKGGTEFEILLDRTPEQLINICDEKTAEAIMLVRQEKVNLVPGFDGEFGKISIFKRPDTANTKKKKPQLDLF
jgi:uncharacterized protein (TIGR00375 family)